MGNHKNRNGKELFFFRIRQQVVRGQMLRRIVAIFLAALLLTACGSSGSVSGSGGSLTEQEGASVGVGTSASGTSAQIGWESIPENDLNAQKTEDVDPAESGVGDSGITTGNGGDASVSAGTDGEESGSDSSEVEEGSSDNNEETDGSTTMRDAETEEPAGIDGTMTGSAEAIQLMTDFMTARGLNSSNYAVAYKNLATGETFYYNELKQWDACSTYKFPLNLLYYDMEAAGEITEDTIIPGTNTPLSECHHQSLQYSNNELSEAMVNNLGAYDVMKQNMRKYFTLTDAEIDSSYYHHNYFCARMMMDCSEYLYNHQSEYPDALGYLEAAQPGEYFRTYITDVPIAQKYGLRDGYNHDAGIIFGSVPFVLSVYTYNAGGNELIASTAQLFYNYTE